MKNKTSNYDLEEIKDHLALITATNPNHVVFDNKQLADYLNITTRTLQNWRNEGLIAFSQIGACIYYTLKDVLEFLDRHRVKAIEMTMNHLRVA